MNCLPSRFAAQADARAPVAHRDHIGHPVEAHLVVGGEAAVGELVAERERVVDAQADAGADGAGEAVAVVVDVDRADDPAGRIGHVHREVGRAEGLAGPDLRSNDRVREVVQHQQRRLERVLGDDVALPQVVLDDAADQALAVARAFLEIQRHLADARLDHRDLDHPALDLLLRQVGLGEEVAALAVVGAHLGRGVVQAVDVLLLAEELLHRREQHVLGVERIAADLERGDGDLQAGRAERGLGLLYARQHISAGPRRDRRLLHLLEQAAGVGLHLRELRGHARAEKREHENRAKTRRSAHEGSRRLVVPCGRTKKPFQIQGLAAFFYR